MKKQLIILLSVLAVTAFKSPPFKNVQEAGFTLVENSKNVSLYEKWYEISPNKKARELKAEFTIKANITAVISMLQNEAQGKTWNANAAKFEIKDVTTGSWINYIQYDLPWPMDNQDCVLKHQKLDVGAVGSVVSFGSTAHASYPEKNNVNRIPEVKGKWYFINSGGTSTKVIYYVTTTPSATLPRIITDPLVRGNIIKTMAAFRDLLE